jgi:hypothetical protein
MTARPYYTLFCREPDGRWNPQFGDFSHAVVKDEARDTYARDYARSDRRIIRHPENEQYVVWRSLNPPEPEDSGSWALPDLPDPED